MHTPHSDVVAIEVDADPGTVARVRSVATEVLERLGVTPFVTTEPAEPSAGAKLEPRPLAYAYIDLEIPRLPRLVVVDGETSRELTRRTLPETSSLETSIEAVTLVLYMTLESLLAAHADVENPENTPAEPPSEGSVTSSDARASARPTEAPARTREFSRPVTRPQSPTPSAKTSTEPEHNRVPESEPPPDERASDAHGMKRASSVSAEVGAFARLLALGNSSPVGGAGATLGVHSAQQKKTRLGLVVLGAAHLPSTYVYRGTSASITPFSARVFAALDLPLTRRFSASLALGGGADWFHAQTSKAPPNALADASTSADPVVSALLGARTEFARHWSVNVGFGLDLDTAPRAFVVAVGNERHSLLELARFRPSLLLGLAWDSGARTP